jgi:cell division protein ZipA
METLDWLVYVTVGAIVLVLLDGLRRIWVERRNRVVMKLDRNILQEEIDLDQVPNSELPNGGARTLPRESDPQIRKRSYQLKDGRDKVREAAPSDAAVTAAPMKAADIPMTAQAVPMLMDSVEVDEQQLEHTNVFVSVEPTVTDSLFADEELPPVVVDGLDDVDDSDEEEVFDSDEDNVDDHADDSEPPHDEIHEELLDAEVDSIDAADEEDAEEAEDEALESEELENEELEEARYKDVLLAEVAKDVEEELAAFNKITESDYHPVRVTDLDAVANANLDVTLAAAPEPSAEADDGADEDDDNAYEEGEYDDADNYENEPALLENAYKLATSHFHRTTPPPAPRIEPGFGETASEALPTAEEYVSALDGPLDEKLFTEMLKEEQDEIHAWRSQSVTQRQQPPAPETPLTPVVKVSLSEVLGAATKSTFTNAAPVKSTSPAATAMPAAEQNHASELATAEPTAKAPKAKRSKPGFWESVTGKSGKPNSTKPMPVKVDQGELFKKELAPAPEAIESGPQEVIIINVMAKNGQFFYGQDLLPVLQHYGLRLGNMNIFHRHADVNGNGPVMFSMANIVKPGTFALAAMEEFVTPGLSFFLQLPNRHGNMHAFDQMLATANAVRQVLDGDLKDERRSVFTRQAIEHCRQRIRDFELLLLSHK